jgi:hypothetical protein
MEILMPDLRFATIGPNPASSAAQWESFVRDPFGDGSVAWATYLDFAGPGVPSDIRLVDAPGVCTYKFNDDNGNIRYDVRLYGPRADDDAIAAQFRTNGAAGTRLTERKRATYDQDGTATGTEVYESGTLTTRQWRNILLLTGEGDEMTAWPDSLIEHTWQAGPS